MYLVWTHLGKDFANLPLTRNSNVIIYTCSLNALVTKLSEAYSAPFWTSDSYRRAPTTSGCARIHLSECAIPSRTVLGSVGTVSYCRICPFAVEWLCSINSQSLRWLNSYLPEIQICASWVFSDWNTFSLKEKLNWIVSSLNIISQSVYAHFNKGLTRSSTHIFLDTHLLPKVWWSEGTRLVMAWCADWYMQNMQVLHPTSELAHLIWFFVKW